MSKAPAIPPHERAHLLAVAGLLHDAGKAIQPASPELPATVSGLESLICPTDPKSNRYTHRHVVYTAYALDSATSNFGGLDRSKLFQVACYHHRPSTDVFDEHLITKADWMASGHDRRAAVEGGESVTGLWPILSSLAWPKPNASSADSRMVPTASLSFEDEKFLPTVPQTAAQYRDCCKGMMEEIQQGLNQNFQSVGDCVDGLLGLAERTFHSVPSSRDRHQQPDVSLFDHSRAVAAFGACLAMQFDTGPCDARKINGKYRLVSLGLGGIQPFLFRVVSPADAPPGERPEKRMAKRLRARSMLVNLLTWLAGRRVLDALGLPPVNLLINAGGRALLLLPDTEAVLKRLDEVQAYIENWFVRELGGIIRLDFAVSEPLDDEDFMHEGFLSTFRNQDLALSRSKLRFQFPNLRDGNGWSETGWIDEQIALPVDRGEFDDRLERWGSDLPKAKFLSLNSEDHGLGLWWDLLGYKVQFHETLPVSGRVFALSVANADAEISRPLLVTARHVPKVTVSNLSHLADLVSRGDASIETRESLSVGDLLTFEQLAQLSLDERGQRLGQPMLGALKADVDRLGMLMGYGMGERVSIGRYSSLARSLDLFFKGFLTRRLEEQFPHIYTVFAGGDDLFLIGPWYDVVRFTGLLRGWFDELTCGNPNVTFSAGVVFAKPRTPVRFLAQAAEEALQKAKEPHRNSVTVGSSNLTWPQLDSAIQLHQTLRRLSIREDNKEPVISASLVYRLLQYGRMAHGSSPTDLKWRSQLNYDLKRNLPVDRSREFEELHRQLLEVRTQADASVLDVAASLTLYALRGD